MNNHLTDALPVVDTAVELCALLTDRPKYVIFYVQVAVQVSVHQHRR